MTSPIQIPNNSRVQTCYDTLEQETPALWRLFQEQLLNAANADEPADVRMRKMIHLAKEIWQGFLATDTNRSARVVAGSWKCCVGDLAEALLEVAIPDVTTSTEAVERKRERLEALLALVRQDLTEAPNSPSMTLALQAALLGLA